MIRTKRVPFGGTLGIFAGSGPFVQEPFEAGVACLQSRGFRVIRAPKIEARQGFLAGSDDTRVRGIHHLLERDDVHALIAARGGYGLTRIVQHVDRTLWGRSPRPMLGFSDVTALHALSWSEGLESFHGPVVTQLSKLPESDIDALVAALCEQRPTVLRAEGPVLSEGQAEGPIWGGNLEVLTALIGTPTLRGPVQGGLLLLEDVGVLTYRLDRLLTQLRLSGLLDSVRGILLGDFGSCRPAQEGHPTALEVLSERLGDLGVPVLAGLPVGHGDRNQTLPLGRTARLDTRALCVEVEP